MKLRLLVVLYLFTTNLQAQTGSWNGVNIKLKIKEKWGLVTENELRSLRFYDDFHYYELKAGVSYLLSKNISITGGLGLYKTYSPGGNFKNPKLENDFGTFLQLNISQPENRFKLEHRYRAEQRWTNNNFVHRFRYRFSTFFPLTGKNIVPKVFYLNSSDEVFFTTRPPYFIQNRFIAGCGYVFSETFTYQIGYLLQSNFSTINKISKKYFYSSFLINLKLKNKKK